MASELTSRRHDLKTKSQVWKSQIWNHCRQVIPLTTTTHEVGPPTLVTEPGDLFIARALMPMRRHMPKHILRLSLSKAESSHYWSKLSMSCLFIGLNESISYVSGQLPLIDHVPLILETFFYSIWKTMTRCWICSFHLYQESAVFCCHIFNFCWWNFQIEVSEEALVS